MNTLKTELLEQFEKGEELKEQIKANEGINNTFSALLAVILKDDKK